MIVSRDFHKITTDGGRIGSLASEARGSQVRGPRVPSGAAETAREGFENVDIAVVGEVDLRRLPGARRPLSLSDAEDVP